MFENDNNNGESSNGRIPDFDSGDVGSTPASPSKFNRKLYMREYQKQWYKKNSQKTIQRTNEYRKQIKKWFNEEILAKSSCVKCGENHPGCLDFHHRDPALKENEVTLMVNQKRTKDAILKEMAKCDILCANCHRKLHYEERKQ